MLVDGAEKYGDGAFGPRGRIINTERDFHVKTEFISDNSFKQVHKLKTTLSQDGRKMDLKAKCSNYLKNISPLISGKLGFIMAHWEDPDDLSLLAQGKTF